MNYKICYFRPDGTAAAIPITANNIDEAVSILFSKTDILLRFTEGKDQKNILLCDDSGLIVRTADLISRTVTK